MSPGVQREEEVFADAAQLPPDQRAAYLDKACAAEPALRRRIEGLLGALDRASPLLKEPPLAEPARTRGSSLPAEKPGDRIGRYKLLEQIGEGGCGVVYVAEQEEPVRRRVALKVIKLGMDTKQVIARFDAERQALAMMDHPNIAKIHDAGVVDTGRPYFVMELVLGIKITDYCEQHRLSPRERLDLFIQVCRAIQHAHQKGVIHRDIKPSNILVASNDGVPVPKVIDFGIAKATQGRLTDQTVYTAFEQFIGTPAYMSPEQAELGGLDIDTRSDIYSLGVLLYELLTGKTPFDAKDLLAAGLDEMRRTIREVEPVKPSKVVEGQSKLRVERNTSAGVQTGSTLNSQLKLLSTDLDWIVMKCLEKDRARRYETANGLATDINRHLNNEPVVARPPSQFYRFQKSVQRNKLAFGAATTVALALVIGFAVSSWMFFKAKAEKEKAPVASVMSEETAQFLREVLKSAGPQAARGRDTTLLHQVLASASERAEKDLKHQPEVQGGIWMTLGNTYSDIGEMPLAVAMFQHAADSYRLVGVKAEAKLARALGRLGSRQSFTGNISTGSTNALLGLQLARKCGDPETLATCLFEVARSFNAYGTGSSQGLPYVREALAIRRQRGTNQLSLAACMSWLAGLLGSTDEGESLHKEALALERKYLGTDHPNIASSLFGLGQTLLKRGKLEEAEAALREAVDLYRKVHDPNHPYQPLVLRFFAQALVLRGKGSEAEAVVRREAEAWPTNAGYWNLLAAINAIRGEWLSAIEPLSRATELSPGDYLHWPSLAIVLLQSGRAEEYRRQSHAVLDRFPGLVAARISLLGHVEGTDFDRACQLADAPLAASAGKLSAPWPAVTRALADYRRKRFDSAVDWTECALGNDLGECACTRQSDAAAWFIQAAACAQLHRMQSALTALCRGQERLGQPEKVDLLWVWGDWIFAEFLGREAKACIEGQNNPAREAKSGSR